MVKLLTNLSYKPDEHRARLIEYGTVTELIPDLEKRLVGEGKAEYVATDNDVKVVNAGPYKGEPVKTVNAGPYIEQPEPNEEPVVLPEVSRELDLDTASRVQLNNYASDLGVENPEKLPNRAAVIKAIEKALSE